MINLNTDVTNIQQLESTQFSENHRAILKPVPRFNAAEEQAARLDVSNQAFGEVTEIMSKEDELSLKASKAQVISETLSDVRLKLRDLMQVLHDPEMSFDANSLGQMDSMSNSLIDTDSGSDTIFLMIVSVNVTKFIIYLILYRGISS